MQQYLRLLLFVVCGWLVRRNKRAQTLNAAVNGEKNKQTCTQQMHQWSCQMILFQKRELTRCPFSPGIPGMPGNPGTPWNMTTTSSVGLHLIISLFQIQPNPRQESTSHDRPPILYNHFVLKRFPSYFCEWGPGQGPRICWGHFRLTFFTFTHPLTAGGCRGTTDDFTTSFLHFSLFSTAPWDLANSRPVRSLMLSSQLFFCLPCHLPPFTVPCKLEFSGWSLQRGSPVPHLIHALYSDTNHLPQKLCICFSNNQHLVLHGSQRVRDRYRG